MADPINLVQGYISYGTTASLQLLNKVVTNPAASKKALQLAGKVIEAFNWSHGVTYLPEIGRSINGTVDLLNLYGTMKVLTSWVAPLSSDTVDQEALAKSVSDYLVNIVATKKLNPQEFKALIGEIIGKIAKSNFYNEEGAREVVGKEINTGLQKHGINDLSLKDTDPLVIQKKSQAFLQQLSKVCTTVAAIGGGLMILGKSKVIDLQKLAAVANQIGIRNPAFLFVINLGLGTVVGIVDSGTNILLFADATHRMINSYRKSYAGGSEEDIAQARKELRGAIIDMVSSGMDGIAGMAPLLFALNPPAIIALAAVAKGTGLICILIR